MAKNNTNGKALTEGIFQGKVIEGLDNIKEKLDHHSEQFKDVYDKIECNSKDIATARGMAKGGMIAGGLGFGGGLINFIKGMFGGI